MHRLLAGKEDADSKIKYVQRKDAVSSGTSRRDAERIVCASWPAVSCRWKMKAE